MASEPSNLKEVPIVGSDTEVADVGDEHAKINDEEERMKTDSKGEVIKINSKGGNTKKRDRDEGISEDIDSDDDSECSCPCSDCGGEGFSSDEENPPLVHEMNHNDEWKMAIRKNRLKVYKNGVVIYNSQHACGLKAPSPEAYISHGLSLQRAIGYRGEVDFAIIHSRYLHRSMSEYTADFNSCNEDWKNSPENKALVPFLDSFSNGKAPVTNIVSFCLGSLHTFEDEYWKSGKISRTQLSILLTIKTIMEKNNGGEKIKCVAQDPDFSLLDKLFMKNDCGIKVVQDPQGFAAINESSLVWIVGGFHCLSYVMAKGPRPAAIIQHKNEGREISSVKLAKKERSHGGMAAVSRLRSYEEDCIEEMLKDYDEKSFPNEGGYGADAMEGVSVYWRRV